MKGPLRTGALAGAAGGVASAIFLRLVGERSIDAAVAIEHAGVGVHDERFSRSTQHLGGMIGTTLVGVAFGVLLAVVFTRLRPRLVGRTDWHRALWLGAVAWITLHLVPALKYPPNPPAVGDPDTVGARTSTFLLLMAFSVLAAVAAATFAAWTARRGADEQLRAVTGVLAFAALVTVALLVFPASPDPVRAPVQLVWRFRLQSLGGTAILWLTAAAVLGRLVAPPVKPRVPGTPLPQR